MEPSKTLVFAGSMRSTIPRESSDAWYCGGGGGGTLGGGEVGVGTYRSYLKVNIGCERGSLSLGDADEFCSLWWW